MLLQRGGPSSDASSSDAHASAAAGYRTSPLLTTSMPPGVAHIVANEAAERFSFYGMKAILVVFMTRHMRDASGQPAYLSEAEAREYYHAFTSAVYFTPLLGALVAEGAWGKYTTIIWFSLVYCGGHLTLALNETFSGLALGLGLIALGAGGIKPCVSSNLGDQFGALNQPCVTSAFGYFYLAINIGAFASSLATPLLLHAHGAHAAFGLPGVLMVVATLVFWSGRRRYTHVPPGGAAFVRDLLGAEGRGALRRLGGLYCFLAVFWSLYDQTGSAWVLQVCMPYP